MGRRADDRHVGRGAAADQLERDDRQRRPTSTSARRKLAAGDDARAQGRQGRRAHHADELRCALLVRSGLRARRDARLGRARCTPRATRSSRCSATDAARDALNAKAQSPDNPLRMVADWGTKIIFDVVAPENEQYRGRTVGEIAAERRPRRRGTCSATSRSPTSSTPASVLRSRAETRRRLEGPHRGVARHASVIGASDAGAHFDLLASFNYATGMLGKAVRQRQLLSLRRGHPPDHRGAGRALRPPDRGRIEKGWYADVVVLDPTTDRARTTSAMRFDLPGGAGRLYAEADGIDHVLVNGAPIVTDGALTAERRHAAALRPRHRHARPSTDLPYGARRAAASLHCAVSSPPRSLHARSRDRRHRPHPDRPGQQGLARRRPPRRHGGLHHRGAARTRSRRRPRARRGRHLGLRPAGRRGGLQHRPRRRLLAGLRAVAGVTVNRYCSSSLQTIRMAAHAIKAGEGDVFVAGGVESVSRFQVGGRRPRPAHNEKFADAEVRSVARPPATAATGAADRSARHLHRDGPDRRERGRVQEGLARARWTSSPRCRRTGPWSRRRTGFFEREITPVTTARRHRRHRRTTAPGPAPPSRASPT